ncbi:MAG: hypothetical protein HOO00_00865, partial [Rhodospirillaceae bacterium]|nr:hypothetical protein [Rhodospirillaceae bacterium]
MISEATPLAARGRSYDVVFLDGLHNNEQVLLDFLGVLPYLANTTLVVWHDVAVFDLWPAVDWV